MKKGTPQYEIPKNHLKITLNLKRNNFRIIFYHEDYL